MKSAQELITQLQSNSTDTPYEITSTERGFRMSIKIADVKWYTLLYKNGLKRTFNIDAVLNPKSGIARTTDTMYQLDWQGGANAGTLAPRLGAKLNVQKGEVISFQSRKEFGISENGTVGKTVDYTFSSQDAKRWLDGQLAEAGWKRGLGKEAKGALIFGIFTLVLLVVLFGSGFFLGWYNN